MKNGRSTHALLAPAWDGVGAGPKSAKGRKGPFIAQERLGRCCVAMGTRGSTGSRAGPGWGSLRGVTPRERLVYENIDRPTRDAAGRLWRALNDKPRCQCSSGATFDLR